MKTAIIGLGNIGNQVALNLIASGQQLIVADHGRIKAQDFADASRGKAQALATADAVEKADLIVLAISSMRSRSFFPSTGISSAGRSWLIHRTRSLQTGTAGSERPSCPNSPQVVLSQGFFLPALGWSKPSAA
jgi:hypothetical protein